MQVVDTREDKIIKTVESCPFLTVHCSAMKLADYHSIVTQCSEVQNSLVHFIAL